MKRIKFKYKLIAIILLVTFISLFSYLAFVTVKNFDSLREEMSNNITIIAKVIGNNLIAELKFDDKKTAKQTLEKLNSISYIKNAVIFDKYKKFFQEFKAEGPHTPLEIPQKYGSFFKEDYFIYYEKIIYNKTYYGDILLRASTDQLKNKILQYIKDISIFIILLLVVIFFLTWRLQRYISSPILHLTDVFKKTSQHRDYSLKLEKIPNDEIGILYEGYNEMMGQIHRHQQELKNHKENLEVLVEKRTKQLKERNLQMIKAKEEAENANQLKSEFLANMSHEIRTPLNAILGFTDILLEDETDGEKKFYLTTVKKSGENLLNLINDILDFSKIEANRMEISKEVFSPRELLYHLRSIFSVKAKEKNLYLKIFGLKNLPIFVSGDSNRFNQVLINILANAFKFTETGGITLKCNYDNPFISIKIIDTGIGISEEQQKKIFTPFVQADGSTSRKYGGTGLGLAISMRMIELMEGKITLESELGNGSTFTVSLPLPESEPWQEITKEHLIAKQNPPIFEHPKNIAFFEDSLDYLDSIQNVLPANNFRILKINLNTHPSEWINQEIDMVFLASSIECEKEKEIRTIFEQNFQLGHIPIVRYPLHSQKELNILNVLNKYFRQIKLDGNELVQSWIDENDNDEQVKQILFEAIASLPKEISKLENAIVNHDISKIQFISHSLKGVSLNLNMKEIADYTTKINIESRNKHIDIKKIQKVFIHLKKLILSIPGTYLFPPQPEKKEKETKKMAAVANGMKMLKIIVAEDEIINQKLIQTYFKRMGRLCDIAENGKIALEMMKNKVYDILFLDIHMPVMDGIQTIKAIRQTPQIKEIYVVALTANALKGDREKYLNAGCDDYLAKPYSAEKLKDCIDAYFESHL